MSIIASPNPLEMLLLFLLGGGFGLPSGIPPTEEAPLAAQVAPADCLFYTSWAGTGTPKADSPNQTEQLLAEREVQDFLVAGQKRMLDFVRLMAARQPGAEQTVKDVSKLLGLVQGKPGALYVSEFRFRTNGSPDVKGAGLLQLGDKTAEVEKLLKELQSRVPEGKVSVVKIGSRDFHRIQLDEQTPAVTWGTDGEYLVVGLGDGALQELLKRKGGASPDWLKNIRARLSVPRVSSVTYVNVSGLMKLALAETRSPETRRALLASGLDKLGSYASVSGLDEKGCVTRALLSVDGKGTGLLSWIDSKTLSADDLKPVGSDVLGAVVLKLDAAWALDLWLKMLDETEPREGMQFRQGMESFRQELGVDFREDILKSFGDTWRVFIQPTGPGALIHGWTLAVQVRDQKKLKQSQDAIVKQLKQQLEQGGPEVPTLTSKTVDGREIHTLDFAPLGSPFAPTWCLTDDEFFLAATPQTLESLLSGGSGKTLAQRPDVAPLVGKDAKTLAFTYIDTREIVQTILPKLPELLQGLGRGAPVFDTSHLPSSKTFLPHLQPSVFSVSRAADGVELLSRRTLPGGNMGAAVPAAVAMVLPAIQASRQAARRMQGTNQLKQILLALHNFGQANKVFPAGYSADKDGKPLLSWRVHILPFIEGGDLYKQFHLDEPWDSPHNKKLIEQMPRLYRAPNSKGKPGMTNYLGVGGADGIFVRPAPGNRLGATFGSIRDGLSNTIAVVEVPDESAVIWTKPADFAPNKEKPIKGLLGLNPGGFQAGIADGSVRFISENIDPDVLRALFTKADGKAVSVP